MTSAGVSGLVQRFVVPFLFLALAYLQGCASLGDDVAPARVSAERAVRDFAAGWAKLVDVRAPHERGAREVTGAIRIQFGGDRWNDVVGELERERFLLALLKAVRETDEVYVICNYEVRSEVVTHGP